MIDDALLQKIQSFEINPEDLAFRDEETLRDHLYSLEGVEVIMIGRSREDREMYAIRFGHGPRKVSIIAGSHADEPIGPMTAQILSRFIRRSFPEFLEQYRFHVVPQMNPDGADRNFGWFSDPLDLAAYLDTVLRELPGDDIEFGFGTGPRVRPECQGVQQFLKVNGPFDAHFSLHGMGFAEGAWCLVCKEWVDRAGEYMDGFARLCANMNFPLHDIDRHGEKGFTRIREGFCTTPTCAAMKEHFEAAGDSEMAGRFMPSSMDWVQSLGGDPLCIVSELPLFTIGERSPSLTEPLSAELRDDISFLKGPGDPLNADALDDLRGKYGLAATPAGLQVRLQTAMVVLALTSLSVD